jgi:hypothetical protein
MEPNNLFFCQRLGLFWQIHHRLLYSRLLYSYIARSNAEMEQNNIQGTSTRNLTPPPRWYMFFLIHIISIKWNQTIYLSATGWADSGQYLRGLAASLLLGEVIAGPSSDHFMQYLSNCYYRTVSCH